MMNFKVTFANGASIKLMGLADDITLDGLRAELFAKTAIAPEDQHGALVINAMCIANVCMT